MLSQSTSPASLTAACDDASPSALSTGTRTSLQNFSSASALAAASPTYAQSSALIMHALEWTTWHHGAIYVQGFRKEHEDYWRSGEHRIELADPLWLVCTWTSLVSHRYSYISSQALYFAQVRDRNSSWGSKYLHCKYQLTADIKHLVRQQASDLSFSATDVHELSKRWLYVVSTLLHSSSLDTCISDSSIACLYRGHFLECASVYTVQTVVVLLCCAQDGG